MKIGLISDTHIPWVQRDLPIEVAAVFKGVDLILHAGDIYSHVVLDELEKISPVLAALGDDDYPSSDARVSEKQVVKIGDFVLWLVHEGPPVPISETWLPKWLKNRTRPDEEYLKPNIIISGHEHRPMIAKADGVVQVNSGSATYLEYRNGLGTVGIIELNSGIADIQILRLDDVQTPHMECRYILPERA